MSDPHTHLSHPDQQISHLKHVIKEIQPKYPLCKPEEPGSMFSGCCLSSMKDTNAPEALPVSVCIRLLLNVIIGAKQATLIFS